ncbi:MAG: DUF4174 domain-containing protein [Croceitalea sp.]|nr:DUF4174 domain-containing protein [Croceitalea sp.]NNC35012.1 DUF4174 domain-containing protein [Croceitalea sp.]NNM18849.1 DUF4174 domain-containing protein [Croceitalea sp.]
MKWFIVILFFTFTMGNAQDLASYKWKNRVIILFSNTNSKLMNQQFRLLNEQVASLQDRDIVVLTPNSVDQLSHKKNIKLEEDFVGLILIGKDGGIKLKKSFVVEPEVIFNLVDSMPMRRAEIRKQNKGQP